MERQAVREGRQSAHHLPDRLPAIVQEHWGDPEMELWLVDTLPVRRYAVDVECGRIIGHTPARAPVAWAPPGLLRPATPPSDA